MTIFKLPDLGEGLPDAEIREWHVKVGDEVKVDQPLVSMETAKAVVEVPSPLAGKIIKLYGKEGDVIDTGAALIEFLAGNNSNLNTHQQSVQDTAQKNINSTSSTSSTVAGKIEAGNDIIDEATSLSSSKNSGSVNSNIKVTPAVRALATKLGVDLSCIKPTGNNGVITSDDVNKASLNQAQIGDVENLKGVRRAMASTMSLAHSEVAPATLFDEADIHSWGASEKQDVTVRLVSALIAACKAEPSLNAWYDSKNNSRRVAKNIHLGLAVDTEEGLFVPVLKNIDTMDLANLRDLINTVKTQVQNRTIPQDMLHGNTITLSNIGTVSGKFACPVVVPPTVAILAIGRMFNTVKLNNNNTPENHRTLPISLTFDHRCVTGGEAARFLKVFINQLELS